MTKSDAISSSNGSEPEAPKRMKQMFHVSVICIASGAFVSAFSVIFPVLWITLSIAGLVLVGLGVGSLFFITAMGTTEVGLRQSADQPETDEQASDPLSAKKSENDGTVSLLPSATADASSADDARPATIPSRSKPTVAAAPV